MKMNLPVILLKGLILLPNNEIRLEFENDESKNILDVAEMFHENQLLVVSSEDPLEESLKKNGMPTIGVLAHIGNRIELPNGKARVILVGEKRVRVREYLNLNHTSEILESIIESLPIVECMKEEEDVLVSKLKRELEEYIHCLPYMSNSILESVKKVTSLDQLTDLIAAYIPESLERMQSYLTQLDPKKRTAMILEDFNYGKKTFNIEKELDSKIEKNLDQTQKDYILREKMRLIKEELGEVENEFDELKERMESTFLPSKIKNRLQKEYKHLTELQSMSPEANVIRTYMEWLLDLPWTSRKHTTESLTEVRDALNETHAGLEKVKLRILEYIAVKKHSSNLKSPILCLVGPPGVGKTTLAYSIASAMGRDFVKISVGGMKDESEIMGHRKTYLGSSPGRIISSMKKAGSNNPVFLIDEIDKMKEGIHGDPASSLLEVLDPTQNQHFSDFYLEEEYDLSQVFFITTANNLDGIPHPLLDRLEIIELSGYTEFEKLDIAKKHLLPSISKSHALDLSLLKLEDQTLLEIIRSYTKEAGVRGLKRKLETIVRKIVTEMVYEGKEKVYEITKDTLVQYLGNAKYLKIDQMGESVGVVNGLAYTSYGGDTLPIEVNYYKGTGKLVLTGSLGDVMKESAHIALSYVKANAKEFGISYELFTENDIHIHVPVGAIKKDGPSAGIALTTALISALTKTKVNHTVAFTGEITLRGKVLPIGGLKEKSIGALRNGIQKVIIPYENDSDLDEVPKEVKDKLTYIKVKEYHEVWKYIFERKKVRRAEYGRNSARTERLL